MNGRLNRWLRLFPHGLGSVTARLFGVGEGDRLSGREDVRCVSCAPEAGKGVVKGPDRLVDYGVRMRGRNPAVNEMRIETVH